MKKFKITIGMFSICLMAFAVGCSEKTDDVTADNSDNNQGSPNASQQGNSKKPPATNGNGQKVRSPGMRKTGNGNKPKPNANGNGEKATAKGGDKKASGGNVSSFFKNFFKSGDSKAKQGDQKPDVKKPNKTAKSNGWPGGRKPKHDLHGAGASSGGGHGKGQKQKPGGASTFTRSDKKEHSHGKVKPQNNKKPSQHSHDQVKGQKKQKPPKKQKSDGDGGNSAPTLEAPGGPGRSGRTGRPGEKQRSGTKNKSDDAITQVIDSFREMVKSGKFDNAKKIISRRAGSTQLKAILSGKMTEAKLKILQEQLKDLEHFNGPVNDRNGGKKVIYKNTQGQSVSFTVRKNSKTRKYELRELRISRLRR